MHFQNMFLVYFYNHLIMQNDHFSTLVYLCEIVAARRNKGKGICLGYQLAFCRYDRNPSAFSIGQWRKITSRYVGFRWFIGCIEKINFCYDRNLLIHGFLSVSFRIFYNNSIKGEFFQQIFELFLFRNLKNGCVYLLQVNFFVLYCFQ